MKHLSVKHDENHNISQYKIAYTGRNCPQKFVMLANYYSFVDFDFQSNGKKLSTECCRFCDKHKFAIVML